MITETPMEEQQANINVDNALIVVDHRWPPRGFILSLRENREDIKQLR